MPSVSYKITIPMILAGIFIIAAFVALDYQILSLGFFIVFFFVLAYIFLFGFSVGQNFAFPIKKILEKANALLSGDLKSRIYIESKDEVGQLAASFNKIAEMLEESKSEIEKIDKTVDLKVKARTQALEETINALEQKVRNRTVELQRTGDDVEKLRMQLAVKEKEASGLMSEISHLREELESKNHKTKKHARVA